MRRGPLVHTARHRAHRTTQTQFWVAYNGANHYYGVRSNKLTAAETTTLFDQAAKKGTLLQAAAYLLAKANSRSPLDLAKLRNSHASFDGFHIDKTILDEALRRRDATRHLVT